jgi:hypothetical protein
MGRAASFGGCYASSVLKDELPHVDVQQDADTTKGDEERRSPIAHQRQGDAYYRRHTQHHGGVDGQLPEEDGGNLDAEEHPKAIPRPTGYLESPKEQAEKQAEEQKTAHKTPFLGEHRKDEIGMMLRNKS